MSSCGDALFPTCDGCGQRPHRCRCGIPAVKPKTLSGKAYAAVHRDTGEVSSVQSTSMTDATIHPSKYVVGVSWMDTESFEQLQRQAEAAKKWLEAEDRWRNAQPNPPPEVEYPGIAREAYRKTLEVK